jgi:FkbM family methyltransferase
MRHLISYLFRPYIRRELPGWGKIYRGFVGSYERNHIWKEAAPRIIRDKRYGKLRILDIREWSDRSFYFLGRWYDLETQLALDLILKPGDTVVDVGANYGHFSLSAAANVGETGKVFAFEPNPVVFARLRTHIALNKLDSVHVQNVGLADVERELELNVPQINSGEASFAETGYEDAEVVTCPVLIGDNVIGDTETTLIKIDVEGFEMRVLKGLEKTIARDKPWIITEVVPGHLARDDQTPADLDEFLKPMGYVPKLLGLTRVKANAKELTLHDFDCATESGDVLWVPDVRKGEVGL